MQKTYNRINWENYPSEETPINEQNLNKMDFALNEIDDRVISLDTTKLNLVTANGMVKSITYDKASGTFTIENLSGEKTTIDTLLEKMAINFDYDATKQALVIVLDDGTVKEIDMSALITEYEFDNSDTVAMSVVGGKVKSEVKNGSITDEKLEPQYLANIRLEVAKVEGTVEATEASATLAESYAKGGTGTRAGEDTDNAKYYSEQAGGVVDAKIGTTDISDVGDDVTSAIRNLADEPKIPANVALVGEGEVEPTDEPTHLTSSDIADNLVTSNPSMVLSARQGKELNDKVEEINESSDSSMTPLISGGTIQYNMCHRHGNTVNMLFRQYGISAPTSGNIVQLPSECRPKGIRAIMVSVYVNNVWITIPTIVNTDGYVVLTYSSSQTMTYVTFCGAFEIE